MAVLTPQVRNVSEVGKRNTDTQRYVGRRTKFGNPYSSDNSISKEEQLAYFELYILEILKSDPEFLYELRGKDLVCWCAPYACHADILLKLANK